MASRRFTPRLAHVRQLLDALVGASDASASLAVDPLGIVRRHAAPADREVVGLVAATLAFGNVATIRASVERVLRALGPSPAAAVDTLCEAELARRLDGFVHRVYRGPDVAAMLSRAGALRREHGSLGAALSKELALAGGDLREGLARLASSLRGDAPSRGLAHLVPDPRAGSACKRLLLYTRWMARPDDGVDLGLWPISAALLVIPVDTHVSRISYNLGLTRRRDASWRTAEDITATLRLFDADDPVKYDFAICHMGVSRDCPSRRDPAACARCVVRSGCRHWSA